MAARRAKAADVAGAGEVLVFLTKLMRDEGESPQIRIRAAELLAKRYGLFTENLNFGEVPKIIDSI